MIRRGLAALTACSLFTATIAQAGDAYVVAGASPGGLWSLLGAGIERAVRARYPDATVTYQTSAGGFANVALLDRGDVDLAIVHNAELKRAQDGAPPFQRAYPNLRAVAVLYDFALFHPLITADFAEEHGLTGMSDLRERKPPIRITINRPGNIARDIAVELLAAHGVELDDIEDWGGEVHTAGSRDAADLLLGRQADMITNTLFIAHSVIRQIGAAMEVRLLSPDEQVLVELANRMGVGIGTIPAGAYDWLEEDVPTLTLAAVLVADLSMEEEAARRLVAALIAEVEEVREVHKAMTPLTPTMMASLTTLPYHPGAVRAYQEAGVDVPGR